ncbi:hypothetical protein AB0F91_17340 [Amycolatopsis sp. NPDC023774]|uniref:hypothetical protein n=1 Tax=Amycolatopsis sp. NPDC023774 TaxID=3155015 RepID=UPI0033C32EA7
MRRLVAQVAGTATTTGAQAVPPPDAAEPVASSGHAARAIRAGAAYRCELVLWTIRDEPSHRHGTEPGRTVVPGGDLPWAALLRRTTESPELPVLRSRPAGETCRLFVTTDDGRADHVRAGYALERCRHEAIALGPGEVLIGQRGSES